MIVSQVTGIPWSFTLHRWDIYENNILKKKVQSAVFTRCISKKGFNDLINITDLSDYEKSKVNIIHMGVNIRLRYVRRKFKKTSFLRIVVPANMVPVKGHKYLIEALAQIVSQGEIDFECVFFGKGPLANALRALTSEVGLDNKVIFAGQITNEELLNIYEKNKVDVVVLPSITTEDGQHEGVPVSLIEAMAYGIPVVSTNSGSISELLDGGRGILIPEKNSQAIVAAIEHIARGGTDIENMVMLAHSSVLTDFNSSTIASQLAEKFRVFERK